VGILERDIDAEWGIAIDRRRLDGHGLYI
jgi:hypothetical protein